MSTAQNNSTNDLSLGPDILERLACPVCHGGLRLIGSSSEVECVACGHMYPIVDGIPVLIAGRARAAGKS